MANLEQRAFYQRASDGVRVRVRLTPAGRHDGVDGTMVDADGHGVLKASVTKAPENGKANAALIKMLAKHWKVAKSNFEVIQGASGRNKVLRVAGDPDVLSATVSTWAKAQKLI